jgi:hypothetical protein
VRAGGNALGRPSLKLYWGVVFDDGSWGFWSDFPGPHGRAQAEARAEVMRKEGAVGAAPRWMAF